MTISSTTIDAVWECEGSEGSHEIMCLVKRPAYELALAVARAPQVTKEQDKSRLHVHLKTQCPSLAFVFDLETFKHFHADLLCLLDYVQTERQKPVASKLSHP
jgi:hypothetical protein